MFEISKIDCTIKPEKFESLNNGIWYYNFDIESETVVPTMSNENSEEITRYKYAQVRIAGKPTISKCYTALLKAYTDSEGVTLESALNHPSQSEEARQLAEALYEMIEIDFGVRAKPTDLEVEMKKVLKAIDDFDVSPEVNSFFLNGLQVWLDKATRVGLMNSLTIEKASGKEISTLWFGNLKLDVDTDAAIQMLSALELYALECYNKTAEHKVNISSLKSVGAISRYDYTEGYPNKLKFTI